LNSDFNSSAIDLIFITPSISAAAVLHDNENLATVDREFKVLLDHTDATSQGEVFYGNKRIHICHSIFSLSRRIYFPVLMLGARRSIKILLD
jgi:hypothetical protein